MDYTTLNTLLTNNPDALEPDPVRLLAALSLDSRRLAGLPAHGALRAR